MNTFNTVVKFFVDCGPFLYPSLLMMAVGLAIAVERYIFLSKARSENRKMWEQVLPLLQAGKFREVAALAGKSESAIGKIISNGLERMASARRRDDIDHAMEEGALFGHGVDLDKSRLGSSHLHETAESIEFTRVAVGLLELVALDYLGRAVSAGGILG